MTVDQSTAREIWFLTGSQGRFGEGTLAQVAAQSQQVVAELDSSDTVPLPIVWRPVLTDADGIRATMVAANTDDRCAGVIAWMHTFSPAKMWTSGLETLRKPLLRLRTPADLPRPWTTATALPTRSERSTRSPVTNENGAAYQLLAGGL
jgi:L-arabinose isomerase